MASNLDPLSRIISTNLATQFNLLGQYEGALDLIEHLSASNIPHSGVFYLKSVLFQEKMGHIPRYQELVTRITPVATDKD